MRKKDELSKKHTCMQSAHPNEMTFVLIGRDAAAPHAIREWVNKRIELGKNQPGDEQIIEALACADTMESEGRKWVGAATHYPEGMGEERLHREYNRLPAGSVRHRQDRTAAVTPHDREEIVRLDGELSNARAENERLRARLDSAYIEGWKKGVVESIDKIAAYQTTIKWADHPPGIYEQGLEKAIELLAIRFASPPEAPPQPTTPEPQAVPIAVFTAALEKSREQTIETIVEILVGYRLVGYHEDAPYTIAEEIYAALAKEP
jgi:hypothetical protein